MLRATFLQALAAMSVLPSLDDDKADPAESASAQTLRVLLGNGSAQPVDGASFLYEGRRYRGTFSVSQGRVINSVPLESYLYSVVPREMPPSWPAEALKTQAIVARTFVLQRSEPQRDYDLIPSEADQVYTGMDAEHPQATSAVDLTAGQVLRCRNGFALALYSSCCGGHTEASSAAWGGAPVAYLNGVPCTYCADAPWFSWTHEVSLDQLQQALGSQLPAGANVRNVALDTPDASGRARFWIVTADAGDVRLPAAKVRTALGGRVLPSLRVKRLTVDAQAGRTVTIEGSGLGHGVGLCQWGARGMALSGAAAADILKYYYPGTAIGND